MAYLRVVSSSQIIIPYAHREKQRHRGLAERRIASPENMSDWIYALLREAE